MAQTVRDSDAFVGVLGRRGRFTVAEPLFERGQRVTVDVRRRGDVRIGDMVLVRSARGRSGTSGRVVRVLGRPSVARNVVEALLAERGHARRFPPPVEEEARDVLGAPDSHPRRDLTSLPTFTIDPINARDFDDAISFERDGDRGRLYVHIADVAAHVAPGSATDREAESRGNSVYVPGAVEPMLPEALSSDACSLVPGQPRKAVTVELDMAPDGTARGASFYRSTIRSDARFTYEQVELIFAGRERAPELVGEPLQEARKLAAELERRRLERGALAVESSEPDFEFDSEGNVVSAVDVVQTESHALIEHLMILANEQVASLLERSRRATVYRVHEQPEAARIEFLAAQLESLDVPTPALPDHITPRVAGRLAAQMSVVVRDHVTRTGHGRSALMSLVLRSLKQAYYSATNVGHAGLGSESYCHFTSPIRRYPDLVVHRALLAAVGGGEDPPAPSELAEIAWHCSQTEREAMSLEREADDVCLTFLLERELTERGWDEPLEAEVSGLISAGAFVSFPLEAGGAVAEGFLPARKLRGEFFELSEEGTALVGRRTGRRLRLGDPVSVLIDSIDAPRGRVDVLPAEQIDETHAASRRSGGARRP